MICGAVIGFLLLSSVVAGYLRNRTVKIAELVHSNQQYPEK